MDILFLTDNFPPEVNAPASRTFEHCQQWVRAGHSVTIITCAPNFPAGRVYAGYRNRLWQFETIDGIAVVRVWTYITSNDGFIKRTLDYMSFMVSAIVAGLLLRRPDVIVATSPQFFTAVAGRLLSTLKRVPWIFELRDIWPESIKAVGAMKEGRLLALLERLELHLYRHAASVVAVTNSFKADLVRRGIEPGKVDVVTNGVDLSRFAPRSRDPALENALGLKGYFVAGYIGTHGAAHALDTLLDAAKLLEGQPEGAGIRLLMMGDGAHKEALRARAASEGISNIVFVDSAPKDEVARYWSLLDATIIHLKDEPLFRTTIPSKMFEAMAMGIPILMGVEGEAREIVMQGQAGMPFAPENPASLVRALLTMQRKDALRARCSDNCLVVAAHYDRSYLADRMLQIIERILCRAS